MLKKILSSIFVISALILTVLFFIPKDKLYKITDVKSPTIYTLNNNQEFKFDFDTFDSTFTQHNKELAQKLGISETEAFLLGNLGKNKFKNLMQGRFTYIKNNSDLIYIKYSLRTKLFYSGYCFINDKPCSDDAFQARLNEIRIGKGIKKYVVLDLNSDTVYNLNDKHIKTLNNFIVIRKSHLPITYKQKNSSQNTDSTQKANLFLNKGKIKVYLADSTTKLKPDRNCSSDICKEILSNINSAQNTIDMAIYGYSRVPAIENALIEAQKRGVKIRLVYDIDSKGENIYPDTNIITKLLPNNMSDKNSAEVQNIMHNKFYIFDDKIIITGSANLSNTDMSGYNSNSIIVLDSVEAANIYKTEFEQMYSGKFHNDKIKTKINNIILDNIPLQIYFSPQDKSITNAVIPIIQNAKKYIYIPTFVLTEKRVSEELINAQNRGVEVKIIMDALNASIKHSKHQYLRQNGIAVKTENYAGKMHSKSMIVDDEYTIIGSMNFSNSGENRNDENLIVIKDSEITKFYRKFFIYQWSKIDDKWLKYNARAEGKDSIGSCEDGIDNNYDGLIDSNDPACKI